MVSHTFNKSTLIRMICLGNLVEWAEYTFYGYMAVTLSPLFFPADDPNVMLLKTFGIFAIGYLMRPFGAIIFGHIGDRWGRKPALMYSLLLMGLSTFAIGCLPTYQSIGMTAAMILLALRICQGIAISGEANGAGIFLIEKIGGSYPALAGSWASASAAGGMVIGGLAAYLTSLPQAPEWAWRIPFMLGGITCFIGLWMRRHLSDTPLKQSRQKNTLPFIQVIKDYKQSMLVVIAVATFTGVFVYIGNVYMVVYLKQQSGLPMHHATFFALFAELIAAILTPVMAYIADKTHIYRQYRMGLILVALLSPCLFMLAGSGQYGWIGLAMVIYGVLNAFVFAPMVKIVFDQFPQGIRYTGASFAWNVSVALFSSSAPIVAQSLITYFDWQLAPSLYISMVAIITFIIVSLCTQRLAFRSRTGLMSSA